MMPAPGTVLVPLTTEEVNVTEDELDSTQDGLTAVYTSLLKEPKFQQLVAAVATLYGVTERKVSSIDQRSFRAAKDFLTTYVARVSGWNAKVSRSTRNGSWSRGQVHPANQVEGRADQGDLVSMGRRSGGIRNVEPQAAADSPKGVRTPQGPSLKEACPSCQHKRPGKVWRVNGQLVCPNCVRKACAHG